MFLLREKLGMPRAKRKVELLATLLKVVDYVPSLFGLDAIAASRLTLFEGKFAAALARRRQGG